MNVISTVAPSSGRPPLVSTLSGLIGDSQGLRLRQTYLYGEPVFHICIVRTSIFVKRTCILYLYCWDKHICKEKLYFICIVDTNIFVKRSCISYLYCWDKHICKVKLYYICIVNILLWKTYFQKSFVFGQN